MNTQSIRLLTLIIATTLSFTACAQKDPPAPIYAKATPESESITTGKLKPHTIRYQKAAWAMNYRLKEVELDGKPSWLVEVEFNPGPESKPDQIWLDKSSLAFRRRLLSLKDYTIDVKMEEGLFSGNLVPAQGSDYEPVVYNKVYKHDAFEPAIINYAIAALPLEVGYTASIPVFDLNKGSNMFWSNIKVVAEQVVEIDSVKFDCWKVESDGIRNKTIWISKDKMFAVKMLTKGNAGAWKIVPSSIELNN